MLNWKTSLATAFMLASMVTSTVAFADAPQHLVNSTGMTVYTYDVDKAGVSNCYNGCAHAWPPVPAIAAPQAPYSTITRTDGTTQLAYENHPLYTYVGDSQPGDTTGDGLGGIWHIVLETTAAQF
jgi:predicted lipoprotein with Yx(FWY)xxD motif